MVQAVTLIAGVVWLVFYLIWRWVFRNKTENDLLKNRRIKYIVLAVLGFIILLPILYKSQNEKACVVDWKKCTSNEEFINNYQNIPQIVEACKIKTINDTKYGEPKFSNESFSEMALNSEYQDNGIFYLRDQKAQVQNEFGAMENVQLMCFYDLKNNEVIQITVNNLGKI